MVINKGYDFSALKILIVDDHAPMRRVMRDILKELGVRQVEDARNGQVALNTLKSFNADLIFTDYMMAPIDGLTMMPKSVRVRPKSTASFPSSS